MRRISKVLGVVALAVVFIGAAGAQERQKGRGGRGGFGRGGFGRGGFGGVGMLILNEGVQKELKLDTNQVEKAQALVKQVGEKHQGEFPSRDASPEERREKFQAVGKAISEETHKGLAEILKPEQMKRLNQ